MDIRELREKLLEFSQSRNGRWILGGIVAILLIVSICNFIFRDSVAAGEISERGYTILFICEDCGECGEIHIHDDDAFPLKCPECGEKKVIQGFRCFKCQCILPNREKLIVCPQCKQEHDHRSDETLNNSR